MGELSMSKGKTKNNKFMEDDFANNRDNNFEHRPRPYVRAKYDPRKKDAPSDNGQQYNNINYYSYQNNYAGQGWPGSNQRQNNNDGTYHNNYHQNTSGTMDQIDHSSKKH